MDTSMAQRWSTDGQVFYVDGWAWGLTPSLKTICLGKEEDIIKKYGFKQFNKWHRGFNDRPPNGESFADVELGKTIPEIRIVHKVTAPHISMTGESDD